MTVQFNPQRVLIIPQEVPLLRIADLAISYKNKNSYQPVVHGVSFDIRAGEVVALVGESGSGKTTIAQAVIGLLAGNGRLDQGVVALNGTDIANWSQSQLDNIRGAKISLIPQDPVSSLNPVKTIGSQVGEILRIHTKETKQAIQHRVIELLTRVGLSQPELRAGQYPHELSGGMRQRVLIAVAIALKSALIIADEPTSALDVTVQKRILDLIDELRREYGTAVLLVTHDLGVAAERADRMIVLQNGRIREQGGVADILTAPASDYTKRLLSDAPSLTTTNRPKPSSPALLKSFDANADAIIVENLVQEYGLGSSREKFRAVNDISFRVARGTTHAIVGESGSGKTTTSRAVVGFLKPTSGRVLVEGTDISGLRGDGLRQFRKKIQLVYQNPFSSLDPRQTVFDIVEEPLLNFGAVPRKRRMETVHQIIEKVGLPDSVLTRKPHALSGGQRQRVAIARALILNPQVLVLDEAVSALDVTVQAQILALLDKLQQELGLTYLFVSHDLAVVRQISDTVSVLHNGLHVESGNVEDVFRHPQSNYTRELIDAIPGRNLKPQPVSQHILKIG